MGHNKKSGIDAAQVAIQAARKIPGATQEQAKAIELRCDQPARRRSVEYHIQPHRFGGPFHSLLFTPVSVIIIREFPFVYYKAVYKFCNAINTVP